MNCPRNPKKVIFHMLGDFEFCPRNPQFPNTLYNPKIISYVLNNNFPYTQLFSFFCFRKIFISIAMMLTLFYFFFFRKILISVLGIFLPFSFFFFREILIWFYFNIDFHVLLLELFLVFLFLSVVYHFHTCTKKSINILLRSSRNRL